MFLSVPNVLLSSNSKSNIKQKPVFTATAEGALYVQRQLIVRWNETICLFNYKKSRLLAAFRV